MHQADPRRVRLIARHFDDLKGFGVAPLALALGAAGWAWSSTMSELATFLAAAVGLLAGLIGYLFVADTYTQLGRIPRSRRSQVIGGCLGGATVMVIRLRRVFRDPAPCGSG